MSFLKKSKSVLNLRPQLHINNKIQTEEDNIIVQKRIDCLREQIRILNQEKNEINFKIIQIDKDIERLLSILKIEYEELKNINNILKIFNEIGIQ